jgi:single-strand selective monofunctional uracil DNA glycosylase
LTDLVETSRILGQRLDALTFSAPVAYVYNTLIYAREPHETYLARYGNGRKEAVFVGMNPGFFGMAQTGVPFGEIGFVRDWMGITGKVEKPVREQGKRPVLGFGCKRSEPSGRRLWGFFSTFFPQPENFFGRFFVINYCPLLFLDSQGKNITPDKLRQADLKALVEICDMALIRQIRILAPSVVIGVGNFAADRVRNALGGTDVRTGKILHPSPANPLANRGWKEVVEKQLKDQGIDLVN